VIGDTETLSSNKYNCNTESGSGLCASMIACHQFNKQKRKKQNKRKKTKSKPFDAHELRDYISQ
jgi:hypothetical protein